MQDAQQHDGARMAVHGRMQTDEKRKRSRLMRHNVWVRDGKGDLGCGWQAGQGVPASKIGAMSTSVTLHYNATRHLSASKLSYQSAPSGMSTAEQKV
eukprot:scaffold257263_cov21-Tisochrysis_lutea.AAC.1